LCSLLHSISNNLIINIPIDYVKRFATEEALRDQEKNEQSSDSESSMSDFSEDETKDMEVSFIPDKVPGKTELLIIYFLHSEILFCVTYFVDDLPLYIFTKKNFFHHFRLHHAHNVDENQL
jgi:hypothetical protein